LEKLGLNIGLVVNSAVVYGQCPTQPGYYGSDVDVLTIDLYDDPKHGEPHERASDAFEYFAPTNAAISKTLAEGQGVLVHCYGSISRSAVLLIAYLMESQNMSAEAATDLLKSKWDAVIVLIFYLEIFIFTTYLLQRYFLDNNDISSGNYYYYNYY